jgi:alkyl hydroperoxide reductase subunit AhpC
MNIKMFLVGIGLMLLSKFVPFFLLLGLAVILSSFDAKFSENDWRAKYHP